RSDELGAMAKAVGVFEDNLVRQAELEADRRRESEAKERRVELLDRFLREFQASIETAIGGMASAAQEMQLQADALAGIAETTTQQTAAVASAAEEAAMNVQTVAAAAEELAISVTEI